MLISVDELEWCNILTPNTRFEPHKYTVTMIIPTETAQALEADGFTVRKDDDGRNLLTAKRSAMRKVITKSLDDNGNEVETTKEIANPAPKLLDENKEPMDVMVGNGSVGIVQCKPYENKFGKFLELQGVQVTQLVEYNSGGGLEDGEEF